MKKIYNLLLFCLIATSSFSQVGINTTTPEAQLDIKSSNQATPTNKDGLLIPKIDAFPLTNPTAAQQGMLVYLTPNLGINVPGFYYWNFANLNWIPVGNNATSSWNINGNSGTNPTTNFLGTTDNVSLKFSTSNTERIRILNSGNVGINKAVPTEILDIVGNLRVSGAIMPNNLPGTANQVLLSSGAGVAPTWSPFRFGNASATTEISKYFSFLVITTPWLTNTQRQFPVNGAFITNNSAVSVTLRGSPYVPAIHDNLIIYNTIAVGGQILITVFNKGATIPGSTTSPSQIPIAVMGMF